MCNQATRKHIAEIDTEKDVEIDITNRHFKREIDGIHNKRYGRICSVSSARFLAANCKTYVIITKGARYRWNQQLYMDGGRVFCFLPYRKGSIPIITL